MPRYVAAVLAVLWIAPAIDPPPTATGTAVLDTGDPPYTLVGVGDSVMVPVLEHVDTPVDRLADDGLHLTDPGARTLAADLIAATTMTAGTGSIESR